MKKIAISIVISIAFGLIVFLSYQSLVTGLSPIALGIVGVILTSLLFLNIILIRKSDKKVFAILGLLLFGALLPFGLVATKKWNVEKEQLRQYRESPPR